MAYNPLPVATETPPGSAGTSKRKRTYRGGLETALCVKCDRGHSILQNVIVFCDGCNKAWHQWCHDPLIPTEVTNIPEAQWFCSMCSHEREMAGCPLERRVGGEMVGLTLEEVSLFRAPAHDCPDIYRRTHTSRLFRTSHYGIYWSAR